MSSATSRPWRQASAASLAWRQGLLVAAQTHGRRLVHQGRRVLIRR
ncbi:hypothetical protein ACV34Z_35655 [Pseudomonas aeruginosa]